ncbi:resolvase [Phaeobacter sp. NW0010-22]|uniref:resolvase n=1 Tax=Phaeobacter sp. NW0010-22 TaxID=3135907 RepID=UPI00310B3F6D
MSDEDFDLFGDPVRLPSGKRGRPAHQPTQKNRNKIITLLALGWSNERISNALHCSVPTLKRYYFSELKLRDMQRDRLDAWRFEKVIEQADNGNIGAHRLLDRMIEKSDLMLAAARLRDAQGKPAKGKVLGKKEQANQSARDVAEGGSGSSWGNDLKPGLH